MEVVKQEKEVHGMRQEGRRSRSMRVVAVQDQPFDDKFFLLSSTYLTAVSESLV